MPVRTQSVSREDHLTELRGGVDNGIFAPSATSAALIERLNLAIVRTLEDAAIKSRSVNAGFEVVSSSEHLSITMKDEMAWLGKLIKDARIHAN